jgi:hypothetical protein
MPSSIPIVRIGICAPRSATKSNRPAPTSGRGCGAELADLGSSAATFRGVNTRDNKLRWIGVYGRVLEDEHPGGISIRP